LSAAPTISESLFALRRCARYFSFLSRHSGFLLGSLTVLSEQDSTAAATRSPNGGWFRESSVRPDLRPHHAAVPRLPDPRRHQPQAPERTRPSGGQRRGWRRLFGLACNAVRTRTAKQHQIAMSRRGRMVACGDCNVRDFLGRACAQGLQHSYAGIHFPTDGLGPCPIRKLRFRGMKHVQRRNPATCVGNCNPVEMGTIAGS